MQGLGQVLEHRPAQQPCNRPTQSCLTDAEIGTQGWVHLSVKEDVGLPQRRSFSNVIALSAYKRHGGVWVCEVEEC